MRLDGRDNLPIALGKGIVVSVNGTDGITFNDSQVKWGKTDKMFMLKNRYVGAKPVKMWISAEPILMLKNDPKVRQFLAARVEREVSKMLSLLTEEHRADLLK
jgi:hypothetical protein